MGLVGLGGLGLWQKERTNFYIGSAIAYTKNTVLRWRGNSDTALSSRGTDRSGETSVPTASSAIDAVDTTASASADSSAEASTNSPTADSAQPEQLLNHRRYSVADISQLVPLAPDSNILLQPEAKVKIEAMLAEAKADGVNLGVISGFRTIEDQNYLYFDLKAERGESASVRAEVSAPPGYSEHHTGYAVDFVDESQPATFLEESFETTPAYKWLVANAPFYNFELSFPKDNGSVAYEPWHWRYVGNQESLELFYR
nr:M15 family metallopeptidase [cf. Phormidesmis sp. LEGE 11477]